MQDGQAGYRYSGMPIHAFNFDGSLQQNFANQPVLK
jgi:hypothetical protein